MPVVTLGEAMVAMVPLTSGPLRHVQTFAKHVGGAEFNTAVALARLGTPARWVSRVGDDEFGVEVVRTARAEGVDVSHVRVDPEAPTGLYFREYGGATGTRVYYYRRGSAASRMTVEDLEGAFEEATALHLTGITPALSPSCRDLSRRAIEMARAAGARVSFDPNIRRKLLGPGDIRTVLRPLAEMADVLLAGEDELEAIFGGGHAIAVDPAGVAGPAMEDTLPARLAHLRPLLVTAREAGPSVVVCKLGVDGAVALSDAGLVFQPALPIGYVEDPIGAGDAFDGGFLHVWLDGGDIAEALRWGTALGACAVTVRGDIEGYPDAARAGALVARLAVETRTEEVER
jgi:2-dehydro-3-deoxygluconokinase